MRRTTVKLPDDLDAKLRHEAARRGSTIGEVTREAIEAHVDSVKGRRLIAAKAGRSGNHSTPHRGDHQAGGPPITLIVDAGPLYAYVPGHHHLSF